MRPPFLRAARRAPHLATDSPLSPPVYLVVVLVFAGLDDDFVVRFEDPQQQKNDALELYCERLSKQPEADAPAPAAEAVPPGADEQPAGGEN